MKMRVCVTCLGYFTFIVEVSRGRTVNGLKCIVTVRIIFTSNIVNIFPSPNYNTCLSLNISAPFMLTHISYILVIYLCTSMHY